MISCILLTAGLNSRFHSPKALARLGQDTVIEHLQKDLINTQLFEIVIVLGSEAHTIKPFLLNHKKIHFVYNKDYNLGQTSSFKIGLTRISSQSQGIMLLPIDYPFIKIKTIYFILKNFLFLSAPHFFIPTYQNKKGHPLVFNASFKEEFQNLDNALGINTIFHRHADKTIFFDVDDPGVVSTFNTQEEFADIKKQFGW